MASWLLKAGVQGAASLLPGARHINSLMQRRVTGRAALTDEMFEAKLLHARRHLRRYLRASARKRVPASAVELGTGWYPVVPIALALCGVRRVVSFDVQALATAAQTRETLERFSTYRDDGRLAELLPRVRPARLRLLDRCLEQDVADVAPAPAPLGVRLAVGERLGDTLRGAAFDLIVSNNTLEHIALEDLRRSLADAFELGAPGAVMDHFIDLRDHYADFDDTISRLNFLRYPDPVWRLFNNRLQYLNRLRLPEYRQLIAAAGFRLVDVRSTAGRQGEFDDLKPARRFRAMPRDEVLVLYAWITAVKPPAGP